MEPLRQQLQALLEAEQAHMSFEHAVAGFPLAAINHKPPQVPYTFWHLLEHLRLCQRDILEFSTLPADLYRWPNFPDDYWPAPTAETDAAGWQATIAAFLADRQALVDLVLDPAVDLNAALVHGPEYTVLREILVVADHNAYHLGEFAILRQTLGYW